MTEPKKKGRFSGIPSLNLNNKQIIIPEHSDQDNSLDHGIIVDSLQIVEGEDAVYYGINKDGRKVIVSGTINKLMDLLADQRGASFDKDYVENFLITHRYFTTSEEFLNKLFERYHLETPADLPTEERDNLEKQRVIGRLRIVNVIKFWLETCFDDFENNPILLPNLLDHISSIREERSRDLIKGIVKDIQSGNRSASHLYVSGEMKKTKLDWHFLNQPELEIKLVNVSSEEIARHLTLIESSIFREIPKDEFLKQGFNDPTRAPKTHAMIKRFNESTSWIATEILREENLQERVKILSKFIKIGQKFRLMNNFNGVMEIYSSLVMTPISRLKLTWAKVSPELKKIYQELGDLMSPSNNYVQYRKSLSSVSLPKMPFQGVLLLDFTFIEENTNKLENGLVNFEKMQMLGRLVREVILCQNVKFNFEENARLKDWLLSREFYSSDELYRRSKEIEPASLHSSVQLNSTVPRKSLLKIRFPSMKELFSSSNSEDESKGTQTSSISCRDRTVPLCAELEEEKKKPRRRRLFSAFSGCKPPS